MLGRVLHESPPKQARPTMLVLSTTKGPRRDCVRPTNLGWLSSRICSRSYRNPRVAGRADKRTDERNVLRSVLFVLERWVSLARCALERCELQVGYDRLASSQRSHPLLPGVGLPDKGWPLLLTTAGAATVYLLTGKLRHLAP